MRLALAVSALGLLILASGTWAREGGNEGDDRAWLRAIVEKEELDAEDLELLRRKTREPRTERPIVETCVELSRARDVRVRRFAAGRLAWTWPLAGDLSPRVADALVRLSHDPDGETRNRAQLWLRPVHAPFVRSVLSRIVDEHREQPWDRVRTGAARAALLVMTSADDLPEGATDEERRAWAKARPALAWADHEGFLGVGKETRFHLADRDLWARLRIRGTGTHLDEETGIVNDSISYKLDLLTAEDGLVGSTASVALPALGSATYTATGNSITYRLWLRVLPDGKVRYRLRTAFPPQPD